MVVLWTANTERFSAVETGLNDTKENLLASIARGEEEVNAVPSPLSLYKWVSFTACDGSIILAVGCPSSRS